jgi:hypothetical protein
MKLNERERKNKEFAKIMLHHQASTSNQAAKPYSNPLPPAINKRRQNKISAVARDGNLDMEQRWGKLFYYSFDASSLIIQHSQEQKGDFRDGDAIAPSFYQLFAVPVVQPTCFSNSLPRAIAQR